MAKGKEKLGAEKKEESRTERLMRFGRNINILGTLAIGGVAVVLPGPNVVLTTLAGINAVQAGGFEWARKAAENKRKKNTKPKN